MSFIARLLLAYSSISAFLLRHSYIIKETICKHVFSLVEYAFFKFVFNKSRRDRQAVLKCLFFPLALRLHLHLCQIRLMFFSRSTGLYGNFVVLNGAAAASAAAAAAIKKLYCRLFFFWSRPESGTFF